MVCTDRLPTQNNKRFDVTSPFWGLRDDFCSPVQSLPRGGGRVAFLVFTLLQAFVTTWILVTEIDSPLRSPLRLSANRTVRETPTPDAIDEQMQGQVLAWRPCLTVKTERACATGNFVHGFSATHDKHTLRSSDVISGSYLTSLSTKRCTTKQEEIL